MAFQKGHKYYGGRKKKPDVEPEPEQPKAEVTTFQVVEPKMPDTVSLVKNNMHRHTVGIMTAMESMFGSMFTPKCRKCYEERGWLTKCVCTSEK